MFWDRASLFSPRVGPLVKCMLVFLRGHWDSVNFSFPVGMEGVDCSAWVHVRGAQNRWLRERTCNKVPRTQWVPPYGLLWGLWQWAKTDCQGAMPHLFIPSSHMLVYNSFHCNYTGLSRLLIHFYSIWCSEEVLNAFLYNSNFACF